MFGVPSHLKKSQSQSWYNAIEVVVALAFYMMLYVKLAGAVSVCWFSQLPRFSISSTFTCIDREGRLVSCKVWCAMGLLLGNENHDPSCCRLPEHLKSALR